MHKCFDDYIQTMPTPPIFVVVLGETLHVYNYDYRTLWVKPKHAKILGLHTSTKEIVKVCYPSCLDYK